MKTKIARREIPVNGMKSSDEGMVVFDQTFQPVATDGGGEDLLRELRRPDGSFDLPLFIAAEIRRMQSPAVNGGRAQAKAHLRIGSRDYSCRTFVLEPRTGSTAEPLLAVHFNREISVSRALQQVAETYHLTEREQEALMGASEGLTSKELAERMNISPNTVNAFFRLIMSKMGVTTRAGVVGKLLESDDDLDE